MKLIVGLGNPGEKYKNTRHNVGFVVLDAIASQITNEYQYQDIKFQKSKNAKAEYLSFKIGDETIELIKPLTFMNSSGFSVAYGKNKHKVPVENIYVIHDDLDIKLGEYKIQKGVGPKLHYGIASIEKELGIGDFWRIRMGVDNRSIDNRVSGEEYVLEDFEKGG